MSLATQKISFRDRPRAMLALAALVMAPTLGTASPASATTDSATTGNGKRIRVSAGQTLVVSATTRVSELTLADGAAITAPDGYSLTVTVNGVEVGSTLRNLYDGDGILTYTAAGTYRGDVVITIAGANVITYNNRAWPIRQAVYVDANGVDAGKSVLAAVLSGQLRDTHANGLQLRSDGQSFNGVWVTGGASYELNNPRIRFTGNGRNDFVGYGSAIVGTGAGTLLVIDRADIDNKGVVRAAVIADGTATVVVKNSTIRTRDGVLPAEYEDTGDTSFMQTCPWLLGIYGTVRSTNLLGAQTRATYLDTTITNDNWGLLSVDGGSNCTLVAVNCTLRHTGVEGYGTYAIGNVTEHLLGNTFDVATYVSIIWGSAGLHFGDSGQAAVKALNDSASLGLSTADIQSVRPRRSVINSRRFGFMWQSTGPLLIDGGTKITTRETMFLSKAAASAVTVDGARGASLRAANGVLYQLMDNDNPGRVAVTGYPWSANYTASYTQPTGPAVKSTTFDPTVAHTTDASGTFTNIRLDGDFYNGVLGGGVGRLQGMNLVLTFTDSVVSGVLSASTAVHRASPINKANRDQLGVVDNTPSPVVNNGVLVTLAGRTTWKVTGTSYLSSLTVGPAATIVGAHGATPTMTVDGTPTTITPGATYTGAITIS